MSSFRRFARIGCIVAFATARVLVQKPGPKAAAGKAVDPKIIVRKAIAAYGGEAALTKYRAGTCKYNGTMEVLGIRAAISVEAAFHFPINCALRKRPSWAAIRATA